MPNFSATNLPVRSIEDLRKLTYQEMNTAELDKLRGEDYEAFKVILEAVDGPPPAKDAPVEEPVSAKRTIWRNGQKFEIDAPISYINGVMQQ